MIPRPITSLQHPIVKHCVSLRKDRAFRFDNKQVLVSGINLIRDVAKKTPPITVIVDEPSLIVPAEESYIVTPEILHKITGVLHPEGIAAIFPMPQPADLADAKRILVLDRIADPGNCGTLLRTALALGWDGVVATAGSVDFFNDKALRAAKGATFFLPYAELSWSQIATLQQQRHFQIYVGDLQGAEMSSCSFQMPLMLVLGNEASGPSSEALSLGKPISIRLANKVESLNVGAAGAILMYVIRGCL